MTGVQLVLLNIIGGMRTAGLVVRLAVVTAVLLLSL